MSSPNPNSNPNAIVYPKGEIAKGRAAASLRLKIGLLGLSMEREGEREGNEARVGLPDGFFHTNVGPDDEAYNRLSSPINDSIAFLLSPNNDSDAHDDKSDRDSRPDTTNIIIEQMMSSLDIEDKLTNNESNLTPPGCKTPLVQPTAKTNKIRNNRKVPITRETQQLFTTLSTGGLLGIKGKTTELSLKTVANPNPPNSNNRETFEKKVWERPRDNRFGTLQKIKGGARGSKKPALPQGVDRNWVKEEKIERNVLGVKEGVELEVREGVKLEVKLEVGLEQGNQHDPISLSIPVTDSPPITQRRLEVGEELEGAEGGNKDEFHELQMRDTTSYSHPLNALSSSVLLSDDGVDEK
jgi:hypothetical protein